MKQYIVDAFTDKVFHGNQAAVCVMDSWISDPLMQNIAKENNFSETAFAVKEGDLYHLRWFTPAADIWERVKWLAFHRAKSASCRKGISYKSSLKYALITRKTEE